MVDADPGAGSGGGAPAGLSAEATPQGLHAKRFKAKKNLNSL